MMLQRFRDSFYGIWFDDLPDNIVRQAICDIEGQVQPMRSQCPRLYCEYVILKTARFLMAFFPVDAITLDVSGQRVTLKSLSDTGAVAQVRRDSIDSSISRDYYEAKLPAGKDWIDFPFGVIAFRMADIEAVCHAAIRPVVGFGSNFSRPGCFDGMVNGGISPHAAAYQCRKPG